MVVIEDGLGNYDEKWLIKPQLRKHKKLLQFIYGPNIVKGDYGLTDQAKRSGTDRIGLHTGVLEI